MDENEVIKDILSGNVDRYSEIVLEYQEIVANLCFKLGGPNIDISEVTQQVFVDLYQALPRFQFKSKLSTFIYRITLNVVCKNIKHRSRIIATGREHPIDTPSGERNIEQSIVYNEQHRQLHQAIGQLHQEQRTALVLYTFNDFSYQDIADVMQCSLAKVESLIFRAKKNLRKMLDGKN